MRQNGLSESSIKKYEGAVTGALTLWAKDSGLIDGSLVDVINLPEFLSLSKKVEVLPIFEQRNATGHHMYSSALVSRQRLGGKDAFRSVSTMASNQADTSFL